MASQRAHSSSAKDVHRSGSATAPAAKVDWSNTPDTSARLNRESATVDKPSFALDGWRRFPTPASSRLGQAEVSQPVPAARQILRTSRLRTDVPIANRVCHRRTGCRVRSSFSRSSGWTHPAHAQAQAIRLRAAEHDPSHAVLHGAHIERAGATVGSQRRLLRAHQYRPTMESHRGGGVRPRGLGDSV